MKTQSGLTPQDRLREIFTRELNRLQDQHALTDGNPSGRGITSAILDAWRWLDQPGTTWEILALRVQGAFEEARTEHAISSRRTSDGTGTEDFFAYARADGLSGVLGWIKDINGR